MTPIDGAESTRLSAPSRCAGDRQMVMTNPNGICPSCGAPRRRELVRAWWGGDVMLWRCDSDPEDSSEVRAIVADEATRPRRADR